MWWRHGETISWLSASMMRSVTLMLRSMTLVVSLVLCRVSWRRRWPQRAAPLWPSELWVGGLCTPGAGSVCSVSPCGKSSVFTACQSSDWRCSPSSRPSRRPPSLQLDHNLWTGTPCSSQSSCCWRTNQTRRQVADVFLKKPRDSVWFPRAGRPQNVMYICKDVFECVCVSFFQHEIVIQLQVCWFVSFFSWKTWIRQKEAGKLFILLYYFAALMVLKFWF